MHMLIRSPFQNSSRWNKPSKRTGPAVAAAQSWRPRVSPASLRHACGHTSFIHKYYAPCSVFQNSACSSCQTFFCDWKHNAGRELVYEILNKLSHCCANRFVLQLVLSTQSENLWVRFVCEVRVTAKESSISVDEAPNAREKRVSALSLCKK